MKKLIAIINPRGKTPEEIYEEFQKAMKKQKRQKGKTGRLKKHLKV